MMLSLIHQLNGDQVRQLHALFQNEWWTKGRSLEDVQTMLEHSNYVFGCCDNGSKKLVGFARVLTDRVFKAFIFDVIVHPDFRGRGIGKLLMDAILEHPQFSRVKHIELYCRPEMIPYYQRWGFTDEIGDIRLMRRVIS